ncbi:Mss4-like protein [Tirmania nivea]|nr:Mss4-like protein [Tirmania nivea]
MAASLSATGSQYGHRAAAALPADPPTTALPPLAGQCLCGDFTIVISNPRPGMIMCHCYHCQINSASFFGTYITTESRRNMMIIQSQKSRKHKPELRMYDAQPIDAPHKCPRTFCRGCGTMLFAEPSSIGVLVVNCGLFQNHKFHPAMKPSLEIFATRRSSWLTRREDALQADAMPVFPSAEDDTETEAAISRRGSRSAEGQWDGADDDADIDGDEDDGDFEHYHSDGENRSSPGGFAGVNPEVRSSGETPRGERRRLSPGLLIEETIGMETEQESAVQESCALGTATQKRSRDGKAEALGMENLSSSGSRGRHQRYQGLEIDHGCSGNMMVPTPSFVQRNNERQREK